MQIISDYFQSMSIWDIVSFTVSAAISLLMLYQIVYIVIGLFARINYPEAKEDHNYGIVICARNEQSVIGQLIDSIRKQDYPQDKLRIFVVADNCDTEDATAAIARDMGCEVFERCDSERVGKSFALDFIFRRIAEDYPCYDPDGWFVFDADNLLDGNYIKEMNKCFDAGNKIVTSYRDSKNFGSSLCSMGASVHFIRECRFVHTARNVLNVSTHISGTGFLVSSDILDIRNGWQYRRMTEDVEFSIDKIVHGEKIAYCDSAIYYDEQPTSWKQTYRQRIRWQKGSYQVAAGYTGRLIKNMFNTGKFVFYDMAVYFTVSLLITFWLLVGFIVGNVTVGMNAASDGAAAVATAIAVNTAYNLVTYYLGLFVYGSLAVIKDWKRIKAPGSKKLAAIFAYPIFMICLFPVVFLGLFAKAMWKPIIHTQDVSIEQLTVDERAQLPVLHAEQDVATEAADSEIE